ncbi:MAG: hypothetical protein A2Z21_06355 [Candidatus Fraserbacteria bacterium RBG_16_55_9]|uniref:Cytochrome c domain-containing protein n=1 Tax=Fraserbacteria sp. (strain RBG_16_55_9) TaxID=1817864 RepID=A0A1F5UZX0_FRAXR|nr:MAG: hypothetical protein A2Z21_06355 [Candidatus Fraserbacteria bacterium RBG_16_55_9]
MHTAKRKGGKMSRRKTLVVVASIAILAAAVAFALAQEEDKFAWVPAGGCTLTLEVVKNCTNCDDIVTIVTSQKTRDEWKAYFEGKETSKKNESEDQKGIGALQGLTEQKINTLLDYLTLNMPVVKDQLPADPAKIDCTVLPMDGKQELLQFCLSCHPISVPAYEDRDLEGWLALLEDRTHITALDANKVTEKQRQELAHYLTYNMPIPEDQIPQEFRGRPPGY